MIIWFTTSGSCAELLGTLGASPLSSCGMMELNKWRLAYTYSILTLYKLLAEGDENMNYIVFPLHGFGGSRVWMAFHKEGEIYRLDESNPSHVGWMEVRARGPSGEVRKKGLSRGSVQSSRDLLVVGILESVIFLKLQGEQCTSWGMGYLGILIECRRKKTMIAFLVPVGEGKDVSCRKYFAVKQQKQCRLCPFILSLIIHKEK